MVTAIIATSIVLLALSLFLIAMVFSYTKRQRTNKLERQQLKASFQQEILRTQLEIQEETLKNISQEIHDNIGQTLSLAKLNLNTIPLEQHGGFDGKIVDTKELISKAILDLRALSKMLNTEAVLSNGLVRSIESVLEQLKRSGEFKTELNITGNPVELDSKQELILFRIVQEAISNSVKHSGGTKISVGIQYAEQCILSIKDNGCGIRKELTAEEMGLGLKNIKSRTLLIGGVLDINSRENGTEIIITIPITSK